MNLKNSLLKKPEIDKQILKILKELIGGKILRLKRNAREDNHNSNGWSGKIINQKSYETIRHIPTHINIKKFLNHPYLTLIFKDIDLMHYTLSEEGEIYVRRK